MGIFHLLLTRLVDLSPIDIIYRQLLAQSSPPPLPSFTSSSVPFPPPKPFSVPSSSHIDQYKETVDQTQQDAASGSKREERRSLHTTSMMHVRIIPSKFNLQNECWDKKDFYYV